MMFRDKAVEVINKFAQDLNVELDQPVSHQGNRFSAMLKKK